MRTNNSGNFARSPLVRAALVLASFLLLIPIISSQINLTSAHWIDAESTHGSVSAGTLEPVNNLACRDSQLLSISLGRDQVQIDWQRPSNVPLEIPIEYEIRWTENSLLGGTNTGTLRIPGVSYTHTRQTTGLLSNLLRLTMTIEVTPVIPGTSWEGPPQAVSGRILDLFGLLGIRLTCN
ncbi:hypothetical protein [Glutamicibacter uratoxydans]|uniref:hypothetical protein n=1 Tax=Glutamicibacter uratoxydans TaxID=43667 RepID=UPI003D6EC9F1